MKRALVNRLLLAGLGLTTAAGGTWLAVTGFAGDRVPGWWPGPAAGDPLFDRGRYGELQARDWWDPAALAASAALALFLLCWLYAQLPSGQRRLLSLPRPSLRLRTLALTKAVEQDIQRLPSVRAVRVRITKGRRGTLRPAVTVHLRHPAQPALLLRELDAGPLENLRTATEAERVEAVVRLRYGQRRGVRVR